MRVIADTHVHLYPFYDLRAAIDSLVANLGRLEPGDAVKAAFLAERHDCRMFRDIASGKVQVAGYAADVSIGAGALRLKGEKGETWLFPGRQVIAKERIEIIAFMTDMELPDGLPAVDVVNAVRDAGAVPVLSWAPGKWFGGRGEIIKRLIEASGSADLLIGDTTLRPTCWGEPRLMKFAREKGIRVIAGSDPLPFRGEEQRLGTYASLLEGEFNDKNPVESVRKMLLSGVSSPAVAGKRCGVIDVVQRLLKNRRSS